METSEIGIVGVGIIGRSLLMNIASHGYSGACYDKDQKKLRELNPAIRSFQIRCAEDLQQFIGMLTRPRIIILCVPAGSSVEESLGELMPHLDASDLIVDAGNSHFRDTARREKSLFEKGILYLGMGISGGEYGARHGPCIMAGGTPEAYGRVRTLLEAIAARPRGEPCVSLLGGGPAGHYVKMLHNGIEYGLMQLIAETYHFMKCGLTMSHDDIAFTYDHWNEAEFKSYLLEITSRILRKEDERTGERLIQRILDVAHHKGTGIWAVQEAMDLGVPVPTIASAIAVRDLSTCRSVRREAHELFPYTHPVSYGSRITVVERLRNSLFVGMVTIFAQAMSLLTRASQVYGYACTPAHVARLWVGGTIIRTALLDDIHAAFTERPELPNALLDPALAARIRDRHEDLRVVVKISADMGIPLPGFTASLAYFDCLRCASLPTNLIQAQRDYFGAHGYERIDAKGSFHSKWDNE